MEQSVAQAVIRECISCGTARSGPYCAQCGQRELHGSHTFGSMIRGVADRVLNLERGLVHTAFRLTLSPAKVVRDYLAGRTVPYTHPFGYLLISFAVFALSAQLFGGATGGTGSANRIFTLLLVPFVAGASRLSFRRAGLTVAEHSILVMYLLGHAVLLLGLLHVMVPIASGTAVYVLAFGGLAAGLGYFVWGYSRIFDTRPVRAALGGLAALAGGMVLWLAAVALLLQFLRK